MTESESQQRAVQTAVSARRRRLGWLVTLGVCLCLSGSCVALALRMRADAQETSCSYVLRQICIALDNYEAANNAYPPARTCDHHGRDLQSWRALIMPYLGYYSFPEQYDYSEAWNSAQNRNWTDRRIDAFMCCSQRRDSACFTNYVAVTGPETMWPGTQSARRNEIVNSDAILVVEYPESDIPWGEPRDLTTEEFLSLFEARLARNDFGPHPHGLQYVSVRGEVRTLDRHTDLETLRQLLRARRAQTANATETTSRQGKP